MMKSYYLYNVNKTRNSSLPAILMIITIGAATSLICKCSTIAELDLSAVTPYAIVDANGTNSSLNSAAVDGSSQNNSDTQTLSSFLNSIRASLLVNSDEENIEILSSVTPKSDNELIGGDGGGDKVSKQSVALPPSKTLPQQTPILLTTKSRPSIVKSGNGTLMTVPNMPRDNMAVGVSTVMSVLDLVSMYKDPSFSRGSSSSSTSSASSFLCNLFILFLTFSFQ